MLPLVRLFKYAALERLHELHMAAEKLDLIERVPAAPRRSTKQAKAEARAKTIAELLAEP